MPQLHTAAHVYRRPFAVFFLAALPPEPTPIHDFRRLHGEDPPPASPVLILEMRRARRRRAVAVELAAELNRGSSQGIPDEVRRQAIADSEAFIAGHIRDGTSFSFEATLAKEITFEQAMCAREHGFQIQRTYVPS